LLRLPVFVIPGVAWFKRHRCEVLAAESSGAQGRPIETCTTIPARAVIAVGNEGRGLSEAALKQAALRFHIPIDPTVESLNVAASAAIAVFYFKALPRGDQR
jgi:TrmH family RNA methyltransferase